MMVASWCRPSWPLCRKIDFISIWISNIPDEHLMAFCRVPLAKERCHNPHYVPTIRHLSRNWPSELTCLSSSKFCFHVQILANLPKHFFRSITICLNIRVACPLRQIIFISFDPWFENLHIMCAVKCTNCVWKCNLFCQSSLAAWKSVGSTGNWIRVSAFATVVSTTEANVLETVLWWIPISSPALWKPGSPTCHKKKLKNTSILCLLLEAPPLVSVFSPKKYSGIHATFSSWNLNKDL